MIEKNILSDFNNIRLTLKQFKILKGLYHQTKKHPKDKFSKSKYQDECFKEPLTLPSAGIKEYTGIVPEHMLILVSLGFVEQMDPEQDPIKDDNIAKSFMLTPTGTMFYIYYRERIIFNYLTLIISILSLIISVLSLIFSGFASITILIS